MHVTKIAAKYVEEMLSLQKNWRQNAKETTMMVSEVKVNGVQVNKPCSLKANYVERRVFSQITPTTATLFIKYVK